MTLQTRHASMLSLLMALLLSGSVVALLPASAQAKPNNIQPAQPPSKSQKPSPTQAAQPVLDEETQRIIDEAAAKLDTETRATLNQLSETLHQEDKTVYHELSDDEELSLSDIGMLWEAVVERSGTIRYAIEKLSRQDATGKPVENDPFSKRMLQSLVHLGGVAGTMWTGTPASMIGSSMVQDLMSGNPQDSALSRVTDADMVILAKEVEALQSQLIQLYYQYRHAKERLRIAREASSAIAKYYTNTSPSEASSAAALQPLMQSMYDSAKQDEQNALQAFNSTRTALSLLVGPEAIAALDQANTKKANSGS